MQYKTDAPVFQEDYSADAPITTRLDVYLPQDARPLTAALLFIVAGAVKFGWELRGLWGPLYDERGWAALVVFAIVGSVYMVNYCNARRGR